jgi:NADH-quinone oxidoreductase subunit A
MADTYLPVLILFAISAANAVVMVGASHILNPRRSTPQKDMPYESGMIPLGDTRRRFSVKFYVLGILFIVFDIEAIFLVPWAVSYRDLGAFGFVEGLFFVVILGVGLLYAWRKGALEWD